MIFGKSFAEIKVIETGTELTLRYGGITPKRKSNDILRNVSPINGKRTFVPRWDNSDYEIVVYLNAIEDISERYEYYTQLLNLRNREVYFKPHSKNQNGTAIEEWEKDYLGNNRKFKVIDFTPFYLDNINHFDAVKFTVSSKIPSKIFQTDIYEIPFYYYGNNYYYEFVTNETYFCPKISDYNGMLDNGATILFLLKPEAVNTSKIIKHGDNWSINLDNFGTYQCSLKFTIRVGTVGNEKTVFCQTPQVVWRNGFWNFIAIKINTSDEYPKPALMINGINYTFGEGLIIGGDGDINVDNYLETESDIFFGNGYAGGLDEFAIVTEQLSDIALSEILSCPYGLANPNNISPIEELDNMILGLKWGDDTSLINEIRDVSKNKNNAVIIPITAGLISYYSLDGNANDSHGTNDGTVNGAVVITGKIGQAYQFDGVDDYIDTGITTFPTGTFSISVWVKISGVSAHQTFLGIDKVESGDLALFYLKKDINNYFYFSLTNKLDIISDTKSTFIPDTNTFYHLVGVFDGENIKLYINGDLEDSSVFDGTIATPNQDLTIGCGYFSNNKVDFVNGIIDEVGIWSRALTPDEIIQLYNNGNGLPYSDMEE